VLKELFWLFGVSLGDIVVGLGGLFCGSIGWILLTIVFVGIIIWILANW
jgi:hypothetical protein